METIGIGVIGCDAMGRCLATSAHAVEGLSVVYVSDVQEALAEALATDLGASYTSDYHELLADDRVRVVLIATSSDLNRIVADTAAVGKFMFHSIDQDLSTAEIQRMLLDHWDLY